MTSTERELHLMKVHVFNSEEERAAAQLEGIIGEDDLVITPESGPIDSEMSDTSTNPVENRAIKAYVDAAIAAAIQSLNL
mgnify:FL=1